MPPRLYCGNNANHSDVVNGTAVIGNRRGCLEKGKYVGYQQAPDPSFLRAYVPIDDTKKYCGNYEVMPGGYDRFGGLYECFLKGMGVGKRLKAVDVLGGGAGPPGVPPGVPPGPFPPIAPGPGLPPGPFPPIAPGPFLPFPPIAPGPIAPGPHFVQRNLLLVGVLFLLVAIVLYAVQPTFLCEVDEHGRCIRRSLEKYLLMYVVLVLVLFVAYDLLTR